MDNKIERNKDNCLHPIIAKGVAYRFLESLLFMNNLTSFSFSVDQFCAPQQLLHF